MFQMGVSENRINPLAMGILCWFHGEHDENKMDGWNGVHYFQTNPHGVCEVPMDYHINEMILAYCQHFHPVSP